MTVFDTRGVDNPHVVVADSLKHGVENDAGRAVTGVERPDPAVPRLRRERVVNRPVVLRPKPLDIYAVRRLLPYVGRSGRDSSSLFGRTALLRHVVIANGMRTR